MSVFGNAYSVYYNLLYKDKNYSEEVDYVTSLIQLPSGTSSSLLDIGCGTGKHLKIFKEKGFQVSGVDLSEGMIQEAKKLLSNDTSLQVSSSCDFCFNKTFDVITSLFHVVSYLNSNSDIEKTFCNITKHLNRGGQFVFDFWYGPGCLSDHPVVKIKRLEDSDTKIIRITEPVMHANTNVIDVNFEVHLEDKKTNKHDVINETHKMRYFFLPELEYFLNKSGLRLEKSYKWLTKDELDFYSWYGVIVAKKD